MLKALGELKGEHRGKRVAIQHCRSLAPFPRKHRVFLLTISHGLSHVHIEQGIPTRCCISMTTCPRVFNRIANPAIRRSCDQKRCQRAVSFRVIPPPSWSAGTVPAHVDHAFSTNKSECTRESQSREIQDTNTTSASRHLQII